MTSNIFQPLVPREQVVLRAIIQLFILHATPVGSRLVSRYLERDFGWSSATIRNVMADLEEKGYIMHPHTSAGRMPTDAGYRLYVDAMLEPERNQILSNAKEVSTLLQGAGDHLYKEASKLLGSLSRCLAVIRIPELGEVLIERIEMFALQSNKVLVVVELSSDAVRTLTLESTTPIQTDSLQSIERIANERLSGKPLQHFFEMFQDASMPASEGSWLLRLFVEEMDKLRRSVAAPQLHLAGAQNLVQHPEFEHPTQLRSVIELVENEDVIVHLLDNAPSDEVAVRIGNELDNDDLRDYSLIATTYRIGQATGSLGLIGPKRMDYGKMISLVQMVSVALDQRSSDSG
jgi:heat-inducible transcriptional repressor